MALVKDGITRIVNSPQDDHAKSPSRKGYFVSLSLGFHGAAPGLEVHDRRERNRIQALAAHQHTVDFRLRHQSLRIFGRHTAAVQNTDRIRGFFAELPANVAANRAMGIGCDFGRRRLARANGPSRLIGDRDPGELLSR